MQREQMWKKLRVLLKMLKQKINQAKRVVEVSAEICCMNLISHKKPPDVHMKGKSLTSGGTAGTSLRWREGTGGGGRVSGSTCTVWATPGLTVMHQLFTSKCITKADHPYIVVLAKKFRIT